MLERLIIPLTATLAVDFSNMLQMMIDFRHICLLILFIYVDFVHLFLFQTASFSCLNDLAESFWRKFTAFSATSKDTAVLLLLIVSKFTQRLRRT